MKYARFRKRTLRGYAFSDTALRPFLVHLRHHRTRQVHARTVNRERHDTTPEDVLLMHGVVRGNVAVQFHHDNHNPHEQHRCGWWADGGNIDEQCCAAQHNQLNRPVRAEQGVWPDATANREKLLDKKYGTHRNERKAYPYGHPTHVAKCCGAQQVCRALHEEEPVLLDVAH